MYHLFYNQISVNEYFLTTPLHHRLKKFTTIEASQISRHDGASCFPLTFLNYGSKRGTFHQKECGQSNSGSKGALIWSHHKDHLCGCRFFSTLMFGNTLSNFLFVSVLIRLVDRDRACVRELWGRCRSV